MYRKPTGGRWLETLLFTLSALLLYHTGVGTVFFMIPLQVIASRRGIRGLLAAAGLFAAVFLGIRLFPLLRNPAAVPDFLEYVEAAVVVLLLLGLLSVNLPLRRRPRTLGMLAAITAAAGAVAVPFGMWLAQNAAFQQSTAGMFEDVSKTLSGMFGPPEAVAAYLQRLWHGTGVWIPRSVVAGYLAMLSFSWWAGQAAASRSAALFGVRPGFHFALFRLEAGWLWPLIASGALVIADKAFGISIWAFPAWNVALCVLFLWGLQGLAILRFLFEKHGVPRILWLVLIAVIGGFAMNVAVSALMGEMDKTGLFVMIALPAFGVSENWIRYRVPRDPAPVEKS